MDRDTDLRRVLTGLGVKKPVGNKSDLVAMYRDLAVRVDMAIDAGRRVTLRRLIDEMMGERTTTTRGGHHTPLHASSNRSKPSSSSGATRTGTRGGAGREILRMGGGVGPLRGQLTTTRTTQGRATATTTTTGGEGVAGVAGADPKMRGESRRRGWEAGEWGRLLRGALAEDEGLRERVLARLAEARRAGGGGGGVVGRGATAP